MLNQELLPIGLKSSPTMAVRENSARYVFLVAIAVLLVSGTEGQTLDAKLDNLADRYVTQQVRYDPTLAYFTGIATTDHSRFPDRTPAAIERQVAEERENLREVLLLNAGRLSPRARATYATLLEQLESDLQMRVCKPELWNVNHFDGWQSHFAEVAERQPIDTAGDREQALRRWGSLPHYVDVEIANLKIGLRKGYSAPQSVVRRVIGEMQQMTASDPEKSPFFSPAARSADPAFRGAFRRLIVDRINPALQVYATYLEQEYLPKARESVAVSDLPNGTACYAAFLRANTTLTRTPQQVFELGEETVSTNLSQAEKIGQRTYHLSDIANLLKAIKTSPAEHFQSKDDLLAFSQDFLERAKRITAAKLIPAMPEQEVVIRPLSAFEEAAGVGSRFQQEPDPARPAVYLIKLSDWATQTRAEAEINAVHETAPGHYLQKALAAELQKPTKLSKFVDNAAYAEGWARYAEAMGEEAGIYDTDDAAILRRMWPARGMVVDPGLHVFHWSRQKAMDYIMESGRFTPDEANDYVDRIAVMPGQLTAYDSGGLEIMALRAEAESKLGKRFDLRAFNQAVLEEGVIPLGELRAHISDWIAAQESKSSGARKSGN
jgi:uncharacterized protein (DUF885 family)